MNFIKSKSRILLTATILIIFVVYFVANIEQFKPLLHVNPSFLILIALFDAAAIAINGLFIKFILHPFDKFISIAESAYVSLISSVGNFFAPVGAGFGFRAVYLKKKHGLPYGEFISTLSGNYVIVFLVNSFFALIALFLLRHNTSKEYFVLLTLFMGIFIASLLISFVKLPKKVVNALTQSKLKKLFKPVIQVMDGWYKIVANKKLITRLILLISCNFTLSILIAKFEIVALHLTIGFPQLLLFSVLGSLSLFVNITPANLGVKEAIYIFSATVIGFSTSQILLIALIDRGVLFLTLVLLWAVFIRRRDITTVA